MVKLIIGDYVSKRIYRANDIRAKLPDTARCWTGMCYFVKNVMKFLRELCLALTEIWRFFIIIVTMRVYVCYVTIRNMPTCAFRLSCRTLHPKSNVQFK